MNTLPRFLHLPLLAKELTERAMRWQTYAVRVVYAMLLFGGSLWMTRRFAGQLTLRELGTGSELIGTLFVLQLAGIHLFLPALMCGAVAREQETGSLPLLLLTPISPGRIILQKYFAGLVPMLTFLLLGMPLLAIGYALGGITGPDIAIVATISVLTLCEIGSLTLLCSVCCRTSVRAFVATYISGVVLAVGVPWLVSWSGHFWEVLNEPPPWFLQRGGFSLIGVDGGFIAYFSQPPGTFGELVKSGWLVRFAEWCAPGILFTLASLVLARIELQRRALRPPRARKPKRKWAIDRMLRTLNTRLGGVVFGRSNALPEDRPIAWREGRRFGLADTACIARAATWITALAYAAVLFWVMTAFHYDVDGFARVALGFAGLAALAMMPYAASAFASEQATETLAVLLASPLTAREIVAQKAQFLTRVQLAFAPALAAIFLGEAALFAWNGERYYKDDSIFAWLLGVLPALAIYPQVLAWGTLWLGLVCHTARTALLVAVGAVATLIVAPGWCIDLASPLISFGWVDLPGVLALELSPAHFHILRAQRHFYLEVGGLWPVVMLLHYAFYAALALAFRWLCLSHADRYLRRHA